MVVVLSQVLCPNGGFCDVLNAKLASLLCAKYVHRNMNVAKIYGIAINHR